MLAALNDFLAKNKDIVLSATQEPTSMDAVQLTTILKAYGFHLDSFDFDIARSDRNAAQDVQIEIRCNKSGMLSKLSHKPMTCTCPTEESAFNNSYWEVQGSAPNNNGAEVHEASSNLLPQLSPRVVQFSRNMIKIMLLAMDGKDPERDENANQLKPVAVNGNHQNGVASDQLLSPVPGGVNGADTIFTTPLSSINVTPMKAEDFVAAAIGVPKILMTDTSQTFSPGLTDISTATFTNPNRDIFTSSPNGPSDDFQALPINERDQVVTSLRQIRENIDKTLTLLNFDSTHDIIDQSVQAPRPASKLKLGVPSSVQSRRHSLSVLPGTRPVVAGAARRPTGITLSNAVSRVGSLRKPSSPGEHKPPAPVNARAFLDKLHSMQRTTPTGAATNPSAIGRASKLQPSASTSTVGRATTKPVPSSTIRPPARPTQPVTKAKSLTKLNAATSSKPPPTLVNNHPPTPKPKDA